MGDDQRPFALDEEEPRGCGTCNCLSTIKDARKDLQRQRGCGCLGYNPPWMQGLADVRIFVFVICMYWLFFTTMEYYLVAVITTIEKRFGYSSSHSGFLLSIREISYVIVVTAVSHFARDYHRPRLIAFSGILGAIGGLVFALPHFVYDKSEIILINGKSELTNNDMLCESHAKDWNFSMCKLHPDTGMHSGSYATFTVGSIIIGLALSPMTSLSLTYVDDAVGPKRASLLIGFMNMMRPLGPVLAFILGGIFTSKYETLIDPQFDQSDPRWIGAWWIGYIVIPCLLLFPVIFLPLFPHRIQRDPIKDADHSRMEVEQTRYGINRPTIVQVPRTGDISLRDFFTSLCALLKNPVYMCLQLGGCLSAFVISGLFPFIPKYMEIMFHLPAFTANIIAGTLSALFAALGVLAGGLLTGKMKWNPKQCALFILIINLTFAFCVLLLHPIRCPEINLVKTSDANTTCLDTCHCLPDQFHPVCGADGRSYLSPCEAGCRLSHINNTWTDCGCVIGNQKTVTSGVCSFECRAWIPFAILLAIGAFTLMMASVPGTQICLRGVKEKHRAIAFGFSGTLLALASFVPGPMIYGAIIDSTCLVWRETCGRREECMLYDNDMFKTGTLVATFGFKMVASLFYLGLYLLLRRKEVQGSLSDVRYTGRNAVIVESPTFRDNTEIQLRV